jgi:hypothetical protein
MKSSKVVIVLMLTFSALYLGLALAESALSSGENAIVDINVTNETLNATANETLTNVTLDNQTLINATLSNETFVNGTLSDNETELLNDTDPFANVKGRQPTLH